MKKKYKRLIFITILFIATFLSVAALLDCLKDNITFFYSPSETISKKVAITQNQYIRIGGKVAKDNIEKEGNVTTFFLADSKHEIKVLYKGSLPALFMEDVEIIVGGKINNNEFIAEKIFTKHNEVYSKKNNLKT